MRRALLPLKQFVHFLSHLKHPYVFYFHVILDYFQINMDTLLSKPDVSEMELNISPIEMSVFQIELETPWMPKYCLVLLKFSTTFNFHLSQNVNTLLEIL